LCAVRELALLILIRNVPVHARWLFSQEKR
jgi:hypothetical protein